MSTMSERDAEIQSSILRNLATVAADCEALAAATALNDADGGVPPADWNAWRAVAGEDAARATRDAAPTPPTVSDMRAIFGEPVEGRDYDVMPGGES